MDVQGGLVGGIGEKDLLMYSVHRIEIGVEVGMTVYYPGECYLGCIEGRAELSGGIILGRETGKDINTV